ncbi:parapinopsin-like [Ruditapes philippinarum]|uniref:parapinopsin-like n=1 Tax=Ruditapes philippinarum TaxID=129788 RepID=UPI00295C3563|nr:parapinopsin-like [Ruditapes philippinarum]
MAIWDFGCVFYGFLMTWLGVTATSLFTCVAIERYVVMCKPNLNRFLNIRTANVMAVFCYLHGLVWGSFPLASEQGYVYEPSGISCTPDWSPSNIGYMLGLSNVCFTIPVLISTFCYASIFLTLRQKRRERVTLHHDASVEKNVAVTMLITLFAFLFTWTPYAVIGMIKVFGFESSIYIAREITLIPLITAKTAGFWNPFVFSFRNQAVRKALLEKIKAIKNRLNFRIVWRQQRNRVTPGVEKSRSERLVSSHSNRVSIFQVSSSSKADGKLVPREPTASIHTIRSTVHFCNDYVTSPV